MIRSGFVWFVKKKIRCSFFCDVIYSVQIHQAWVPLMLDGADMGGNKIQSNLGIQAVPLGP